MRRSSNYESVSVSGTTVTISTSVLNNGAGSAGSSTLGYYLSTNSTITTSDTRVGTDAVGTLSSGSSSSESITFDASSLGLNPGTYYIGYIIDYTDAVSESDEGDNIYLLSRTVTIASPSPVLSNSYVTPTSGVSGSTFDFYTTYTGSSPVTNKLWIDLGNDGSFEYEYTMSLSSGSSSNGTYSRSLTLAPTGTHGYKFDFHDGTSKANVPAGTFTVSPAIPNLTRRRSSYESVSVSGTTVTISTSVLNNGAGSAGSSTLGYYLSTNSTITTSDTRVGTDAVGTLSSGSSSSESITFDASSLGLNPGTYYIGYIIDYTDAVSESDEGDNIYLLSRTVTIASPSPVLSNSYVTPTSGVSGSTFDFYTTYTGSSPVTNKLWIDLGNDGSFEYEYTMSLSSGSSSNGTYSRSLTLAPTGTHGYKFDFHDGTSKANVPAGTFTVSPAIPNLTRRSSSYESVSVSGTTVTISTSVLNNGAGSAGSSTLGYYLSTNSTITTSDTRVGTDAVGTLSSGSSSSESITFDASSLGLNPGTYYIGYIIDYTDAVSESDEGDNIYLLSRTVTIASPSPVLSNSYVTPTSGVSGSTFDFYTTYTGSSPVTNKLWIDLGNDGSFEYEYTMSLSSGSSSNGTYSRSLTLAPTGTHGYKFDFHDGTSKANVPAGTFTVSPAIPNLTRRSSSYESVSVSGTTVTISTSVLNNGAGQQGRAP